MSDVFGAVYAGTYDTLYQDKDYGAECDLLEAIFSKYASIPVKAILDLGCGTGNHALPLARRGYQVVGVDRSTGMLEAAEAKVKGLDLPVSFYRSDLRSFDLPQTFDAVLLMFAVLGYQVENEDVLSALRTAREHTIQGGLLVFDVWYGPAVLKQRPVDRIKVIPAGDGKILRAASGELDTLHQVCTVRYNLWHIRNDNLVNETQEEHHMRFFFARELEIFLEQAGFKLDRLGSFPEIEIDPDEDTWNVLVVAKAV